MSFKCIVVGCENRSDQGRFAGGSAGSLCLPCYIMLTTGRVQHGLTFIHKLNEAARQPKPRYEARDNKHPIAVMPEGELGPRVVRIERRETSDTIAYTFDFDAAQAMAEALNAKEAA